MNRFLLLLCLIGMAQHLFAQEKYVYTIKADSVKITNSCDTAELIIENHTQNVPGFLYNKGRGRTEFRRGAIALDDSLYLIGGDTVNLYKGRVNVTASNGLTATNNNITLGGTLDQDTYINFGPDAYEYTVTSANGADYFRINQEFGQGFMLWYMGHDPAMNHVGTMAVGPDGLSYTSHNFVTNRLIGFSFDAKEGMMLQGHNFKMEKGLLVGAFGSADSPTARVHIVGGTAAPGSAPLKFNPGTVLATPENGTVEYDGTDLFLTTGSTRYKLSKTLTGQLTTNFGGSSLTAFNSFTATLSVAGAQPGDVVTVSANTGAVNPTSIIITAYVNLANTVTLQAYNASNSSITIASDTYKVRVIK